MARSREDELNPVDHVDRHATRTVGPNSHWPRLIGAIIVVLLIAVGLSADFDFFKPAVSSFLNTAGSTEAGSVQADSYEDSPFGGMAAVFPDQTRTFGGDYSYALDMGLKWNRGMTYFYWEVLDPRADGHYNFKQFLEPNKGVQISFDEELSEIPAGIYTLANISTFVEDSARTGAVAYASFDRNQGYKNFVRAVVERYDGDDELGCVVPAPDCYHAGDGQYPSQQTVNALRRNPVRYWQVGNVVGTGNAFATFQRVTYEAIKLADPSAKVAMGGDGGDYATVLSQLQGRYMDIFSFHWYGDAHGDYLFPGATYDTHNGGPREFPGGVLAYYRELLNSNGFANTPIWITEQSAYSGVVTQSLRPLPAQTEQQQAGDYVRRYVYPVANGVSKLFYAFGLMEGIGDAAGNDYYDNTGFLYDGKCYFDCSKAWPDGREPSRGTKKLSYYAFKLMTEKLEGSDWRNARTVIDGTDSVYAFQFTNRASGRTLYVAWYDYWNGPIDAIKEVTVPVGLAGRVKITEAVPKYELGSDVTDYATAFNVGVASVADGAVALRLGQSPVYVEGTSDSLAAFTPHAWAAPIGVDTSRSDKPTDSSSGTPVGRKEETASGMSGPVGSCFDEYKRLAQDRMGAGVDVSEAQNLASQADAARLRGDEGASLELLGRAMQLLGGKPCTNQGAVPPK